MYSRYTEHTGAALQAYEFNQENQITFYRLAMISLKNTPLEIKAWLPREQRITARTSVDASTDVNILA
jgi:hypothetical protein